MIVMHVNTLVFNELAIDPPTCFQVGAHVTSPAQTEPPDFDEARQPCGCSRGVIEAERAEWRIRRRVTPQELQNPDLVSLLVGLVRKFPGAEPHAAQIFLIVSELLGNALDHGLLELDSRVKHPTQGSGGMEQFLKIRHDRLAELSDASVEIEFKLITVGYRPMLKIWVKDSGPGFDHKSTRTRPDAGALPYGRGIDLVRGLCAVVDYRGSGNEVGALYELTPRPHGFRADPPATPPIEPERSFTEAGSPA